MPFSQQTKRDGSFCAINQDTLDVEDIWKRINIHIRNWDLPGDVEVMETKLAPTLKMHPTGQLQKPTYYYWA